MQESVEWHKRKPLCGFLRLKQNVCFEYKPIFRIKEYFAFYPHHRQCLAITIWDMLY